MRRIEADAILRPGAADWELWRFPAKGAPTVASVADGKIPSQVQRLVVALPARDTLVVPLWIAPDADAAELADLELSSRHLLRRDAATSAIVHTSEAGRTLISAVAVSDDSLAAPFFGKARAFEANANLWDAAGADLLVWRELGELCFAFATAGRVVALSSSGETSVGPAFVGSVKRAALLYKAEGVLARLPSQVRCLGEFDPAETAALGAGLSAEVEVVAPAPPPRRPEEFSNPMPRVARDAETRRSSRQRWSRIGLIAAAVYVLITGGLVADLVFKRVTLARMQSEAAALAPQADAAHEAVTEWKEFRHAFDPGTFALDQFAAVARARPSNETRLTEFTLDNGRIFVTGEANDVSQAYAFFERIKSSPALQEYDWVARQPQLAGQSKVRFEIEGTRPDAQTHTE